MLGVLNQHIKTLRIPPPSLSLLLSLSHVQDKITFTVRMQIRAVRIQRGPYIYLEVRSSQDKMKTSHKHATPYQFRDKCVK